VRRLGAAFVPMSDAHLFRWWTPEREGRPWFYWTRRDPNEQIGSEEVNEDELDDAVRPIVMRCLDQGWRTTPSCEGHFVGNAEDGIDQALRLLVEDGRRLREGTLTLVDSETEEKITPRIPGWVGPEPARTRRESIQNNGQGCIGFVPTERRDWSRMAIPGWVKVLQDGPLVLVLTHARSPEQVAPLWGEVWRRFLKESR
jgi:hypothetical protein